MLKAWLAVARHSMLLGIEAQQVIGLRMAVFAAGGPAAEAEARLMISEKVAAFAEAASDLALGGSPQGVMRRTRSRVRANARRLSRSGKATAKRTR